MTRYQKRGRVASTVTPCLLLLLTRSFMRPSLSFRSGLLILPCLLAFLALPARAADKDRVGYKVDDFTLEDTAGKTHKLKDYRDRKAIVVVFLGTQVPVNNPFPPGVAELPRTHAGKGGQVLPINPNPNRPAEPRRGPSEGDQVPLPFPKGRRNRLGGRFPRQPSPRGVVLAGGK